MRDAKYFQARGIPFITLTATSWDTAAKTLSKASGVPEEWVIAIDTGDATLVSQEALPLIREGAGVVAQQVERTLLASPKLMAKS